MQQWATVGLTLLSNWTPHTRFFRMDFLRVAIATIHANIKAYRVEERSRGQRIINHLSILAYNM